MNLAHLLVLEKDRRFLPILEQLTDASAPGQTKILGECLDYLFETLLPHSSEKDWNVMNEDVNVIANLPLHRMQEQPYPKTQKQVGQEDPVESWS